jgi:hypothetical protein
VQSVSVEKTEGETEVKLVLEEKPSAELSIVQPVVTESKEEVAAAAPVIASAAEETIAVSTVPESVESAKPDISAASAPDVHAASEAVIVEVAVPESLHEEIKHEETKLGTAFVPLPTLEEIAAKVTANEASEEAAEKEKALKETIKVPEPEPAREPETKTEPAAAAEDSALKDLTKEIARTKEGGTAPALPVAVETVPVRSKFGRIQHANAAAADETLACDLSLAGKLISEAQRSQMALSELIRKVIDLPARVNEQVLIPFELDSNEHAELARRYNVPAGDRDAVNQQIIEELKRFVGDKK